MINFDQAATSFPKPEEVVDKYIDIVKNYGVNSNRGFNDQSIYISEQIYLTREKISNFFDGYGAKNVIFTPSITYAINMVLRGFLKRGDHVLISSIEHNAVARVISHMKMDTGISFDVIPADNNGVMDVDSIEKLIKSNTKAIVSTFGSNIIPIVNPICEIGKICKKNGLKFIVDTAQGGGIIKISMKKNNIDVLCFTGHKSLYGLQGSGGFIIEDEMAELINPIICGGTGSRSEDVIMPNILPDKFEPATLNAPAIISLKEGINFIEKVGIENIYDHEMSLTRYFIHALKRDKYVKLIGDYEDPKLPLVLIQTKTMDEAIYASELANKGVSTRVGLHCCPMGHKCIGTYPRGGIRFSFGYFNNIDEVVECLNVIRSVI